MLPFRECQAWAIVQPKMARWVKKIRSNPNIGHSLIMTVIKDLRVGVVIDNSLYYAAYPLLLNIPSPYSTLPKRRCSALYLLFASYKHVF